MVTGTHPPPRSPWADTYVQSYPLFVPHQPQNLLRTTAPADTQDDLDLRAWLEDPTLFWLHPEGPLSDTTPEEWLRKNPAPRVGRAISGQGPGARRVHAL